ncbi:2-C-methyl-D-erythritol 4-phosphate cytidylyltransferase [Eoetvoesiella caeni]|uniref:2-C-methyl-D-erythritol 4-phosphate cytidylyltransferase n=1 Tax=Eoetvoesiella caeni TaxID=645616 RepID=A0A366HKP3_9BURK|nr:2-C-methyl-D-erythritol 4-phosphate cytidylyltransferase [Eoetvoesiella caeni]MCI2807081.1 2-C-methyl-D-erythritol 4-phosphate cytidylyltransferase [Eoetvoesiella caeni]NYT53522.1 2-C-methyl-D-erythritol 4-phosphate cytidylyltransferase [Eoetvoesiella caeni]RBP43508.1 2-C-methyl-D-erythritol 4-phosphate cytidylyltransferase [Eoetvoesiella caeni]
MTKKIIAIVPAAGIGQRAQTGFSGPENAVLPKQYRLIRGEPMLRLAVQALLADSRVDQVRVAVAPEDAWAAQALAGLPRTVWRPCGGPSRAQTVTAALQDAALRVDDWVLVHDAARPGLPAKALARLIDACLAGGQGGLLAQRVADTVKRGSRRDNAAGGDVVQATVVRDALWLAQTPQMFPAGLLLQALLAADAARAPITDEASAMELAGYQPMLIEGAAQNFKVTWPDDFDLMEKWL